MTVGDGPLLNDHSNLNLTGLTVLQGRLETIKSLDNYRSDHQVRYSFEVPILWFISRRMCIMFNTSKCSIYERNFIEIFIDSTIY